MDMGAYDILTATQVSQERSWLTAKTRRAQRGKSLPLAAERPARGKTPSGKQEIIELGVLCAEIFL